jgi:hypothetical protein
MSDLITRLDQLEDAFANAFREFGDGDGLQLCVIPYTGPVPEAGEAVALGDIFLPRHFLPGAEWIEPWGVGGFLDPAGVQTCVLHVFAGRAAAPQPAARAFVWLAHEAGALYHRLPPGLAPGGPTTSTRTCWANVLYMHLKGTRFVVEGEGHSRIVSLFAASLQTLRLLHWGERPRP